VCLNKWICHVLQLPARGGKRTQASQVRKLQNMVISVELNKYMMLVVEMKQMGGDTQMGYAHGGPLE
jgi:hypothetical protein